MNPEKDPTGIRTLAMLGNYLPRQCGIATFTTDLCDAIAGEYPPATCIAMPVLFGRAMVSPQTARRCMEIFERAPGMSTTSSCRVDTQLRSTATHSTCTMARRIQV